MYQIQTIIMHHYQHCVCACVALTLHVDGKCDFLWTQFIPVDLRRGDALRHRTGQGDTSSHIDVSIPLAHRQRWRCFE